MSAFLRFIFFLIAISVVASVSVVLLANANSGRAQAQRLAADALRFTNLFQRMNQRTQRVEMAVEWTKTNADGTPGETSLLVRQFGAFDPSKGLPVQHVVIPGSRVYVDGLAITFGPHLPPDFAAAANTTLYLPAHVYADGQSLSAQFTFIPPQQVPAAAQIHDDHITHNELLFWNYVWDNILMPRKPASPPLTYRWLAPAQSRELRAKVLYVAFVAADGVTIEEISDRRELEDLIESAHAPDASSQP